MKNIAQEYYDLLQTRRDKDAQNLLFVENATAVYGRSDDLIEFGGITYGEFGAWEKVRRFEFEDGTKISVKYGDNQYGGVWKIKVIKQGTAKQHLIICENEDDYIYSDLFVINSKKKGKQDE